MMLPAEIIELIEYEPAIFPPDKFSPDVGEKLWRDFGRQVKVVFPNPTTAHHWQLTAQGWVGHIPLTPEVHLALRPKVALSNLFRMLEIAYRLDFKILEGLVACDTLAEFYERLAHILARRILDRSRQGLYRAYVPRTERLPYLRGRLDVTGAVRSPVGLKLTSHYHHHTVDVVDNQILAWSLHTIARSGLCSERVLPTVRRAHRALQGAVTLQPFPAEACLDRLYQRLNADYQPLHALCRFFLESSGPAHRRNDRRSDRRMIPFLVDMSRLYERFVAEWLKNHLPAGLRLRAQERVSLGQTGQLNFEIDLVLYDTDRHVIGSVLDTKYKAAGTPANEDIFQIIAYAQAKGCQDAVLVYPVPLAHPIDETVGNIRVRTLTFALDGDLDRAGRAFLGELTNAK